jgi:hypothetical protein
LIDDYLGAGYPALWVHSYEQDDAINEIRAVAEAEDDAGDIQYPLLRLWDVVAGLQQWDSDKALWVASNETEEDTLELARVWSNYVQIAQSVIPKDGQVHAPPMAIMVLLNLQLHMTDASRVQAFLNFLPIAEKAGCRIVVVSTLPKPEPPVLEHVFTCLKHPLPDEEQLYEILMEVATEDGDLPEEEPEIEAIINAARGMTRTGARNTFAMCLKRPPHRVHWRPVFNEKAKAIEGNDLGLSVSLNLTTAFDDVVGLSHIKQFYLDTVRANERRRRVKEAKPRGIVIGGLTGTGKSLFSRAAGNSSHPNRPTLIWDMALTGSKWVSEGASKMAAVIELMKSMSPCNVQVDEGLKAKAAATNEHGGGGQAQASEMDQIWLRQHEEMEEDVYPIFTANQEIVRLAEKQPEFFGRFDGVFFMDYPTREQLDQIWALHLMKYELLDGNDAEELFEARYKAKQNYKRFRDETYLTQAIEAQSRLLSIAEDQYREMQETGLVPDDLHWVGRDIDTVTRLACLQNKPLKLIAHSPVVDMAADSMARLREVATKAKWKDAEHFGTYDKDRASEAEEEFVKSTGSRRKIARRKRKTTGK